MRRMNAVWFRRWPLCALLTFFLLFASAAAEETGLFLPEMTDVIRPGKAAVIRYYLPTAGNCDLLLRGEDDAVISTVAMGLEGREGENSVFWNGTWQGVPAPEGTWRLSLETEAGRAETPITVGPMAPCLIGAALAEDVLTNDDQAVAAFFATEAGTLTLTLQEGEHEIQVLTRQIDAGEGSVSFSFHLTVGIHPLYMTLIGEDGTVSEKAVLTLTVQEASYISRIGKGFTPVYTSPWAGKDTNLNYWTAPMDISEEKMIWRVLTSPITVIDNGQGERGQVVIRSAPSAESEGIGTVTCDTQGVHVLKRGNEWSLIECYSSSFFDSPILNWNALVQGYVLTAYLKEVIPNQELGYVIDKLTQRLYVFKEGQLYSTLQVSTGLSNARQPYNETRSGEFLMTSKVGTFKSDNLSCGLAIRFNKGDLMHEVPYLVQEDGTANYKPCEINLGRKASHGCIRVQRKRTPEDVNMAWIWANHAKNTRLLIWEDWQGRQIPVPSDDLQLYYNPRGGQYYHSKDHCSRVVRAGLTFEAFSYGELDEAPYSKLSWCEYCVPALRRAEIEAINAVYAAGGDHDPVMTEALKTCPRPKK